MPTLTALTSLVAAEAMHEAATLQSVPRPSAPLGTLERMMRRCELRGPSYVHR